MENDGIETMSHEELRAEIVSLRGQLRQMQTTRESMLNEAERAMAAAATEREQAVREVMEKSSGNEYVDGLRRELTQNRSERERLARRLEDTQNELRGVRELNETLVKNVDEVRAKMEEESEQKIRFYGELTAEKERAARAEMRVAALEGDAKADKDRLANVTAELAQIREELSEERKEALRVKMDLQERNAELAAKLGVSDETRQRLQDAVTALEKRLGEKDMDLRDLMVSAKNSETGLEAQLAASKDLAAVLTKSLSEVEEALKESKKNVLALKSEIDAKTAELDKQTQLNAELDRMVKQRDATIHELTAVKDTEMEESNSAIQPLITEQDMKQIEARLAGRTQMEAEVIIRNFFVDVQGKYNALVSLISEEKNKNAKLTSEISILDQSIQEVIPDLVAERNRFSEMQEAAQKSEEACKKLRKGNMFLSNENEKLQKEVGVLSETNKELSAQVQMLLRATVTPEQLAAHQENMGAAMDAVPAVSPFANIAELQQKNAELVQENFKLKAQVGSSEKSACADQLMDEMKVLTSNLSATQTKLQSVTAERDILKEKLAQGMATTPLQTPETSETVKHLEKLNAQLSQAFQEYRKQKRAEHEFLDKDLADTRAKVLELQKNLSRATISFNFSEEQRKMNEERVANLLQENRTLRDDAVTTAQKLISMTDTVEKLNIDIASLRATTERLKSENTALIGKERSATNLCEEFQRENARLNGEMNKLMSMYSAMTQSQRSSEKLNSEFRNSIKKERDAMKQQFDTTKTTLEDFRKRAEDNDNVLRHEIQTLSKKLELTQMELNAAQKRILEGPAVAVTAAAPIAMPVVTDTPMGIDTMAREELVELCTKLNDDARLLQEELARQRQLSIKLQIDTEEAQKANTETISTMNAERSEQTEKIAKLEESVTKLQEELRQMALDRETERNQNALAMSHVEFEKSELQKLNSSLNERIVALENDLAAASSHPDAIKERLATLKSVCDDLQGKYNREVISRGEALRATEELREQLSKAMQELAVAKNEKVAFESRINELSAQLSEASGKHSAEFSRLQQENQDLAKRCELALNQLAALSGVSAEVSTNEIVAQLQRDIALKNARITEISQRCTALTVEKEELAAQRDKETARLKEVKDMYKNIPTAEELAVLRERASNYEAVRDSIDTLQRTKKEQQETIGALRDEIEKNKESVQQAKARINVLEGEIAGLKVALQNAEEKADEWKKRFNETVEKTKSVDIETYKRMQSEYEEMKQKTSSLEVAAAKAAQDLETKTADANKYLKAAQVYGKKMKDAEKEIAALNEKLAKQDHTAQLAALTEENEKMKAEHEELMGKLKAEREELMGKLKETEAVGSSSKDSAAKAEAELAAFKTQTEQKLKKAEENEKKVANAQQRLTMLSNTLKNVLGVHQEVLKRVHVVLPDEVKNAMHLPQVPNAVKDVAPLAAITAPIPKLVIAPSARPMLDISTTDPLGMPAAEDTEEAPAMKRMKMESGETVTKAAEEQEEDSAAVPDDSAADDQATL